MPAAADYYQKVGRATATTLSAPGYTVGGVSLTVGSTTNWPTDTGVTFAIDTVDSAGVRVSGSYNVFRGTVASGTSITNVAYVGGDANQDYSAGATTRVYILVSSYQMNRLIDGLLIHSDNDGTLKAGAVDVAAVLASAVVTTAKITDAAVTTAKLADGAVTNAKVAVGAAVQQVSTMFSSVATGTTVTVRDDTIPQNTEGIEFMTQAITPLSATNILVIRATVYLASSIGDNNMMAALFQDTTASALAAAGQRSSATANVELQVSLEYTMVAGTASETTFRIRAGGNGAGTTTFNGASGARQYGAIPKSSITITEHKAA